MTLQSTIKYYRQQAEHAEQSRHYWPAAQYWHRAYQLSGIIDDEKRCIDDRVKYARFH